MARGTNLAVWLELQNNPLGSGKGENFNVASNYVIPDSRVYVVNHSRKLKRREVAVPVSSFRGAEEALIYNKELAKIYNVDTLQKRVEQGKDANQYSDRVHPVIFALKVGGQVYAIPPARDEASAPPRVEVREGAWDLYLGNYDRMRGIVRDPSGKIKREGDPTVIGDERSRLAVMWRMRHNPVLSFTIDGETAELAPKIEGQSPYGYLEFIRETAVPNAEVIDKEYLSALDLVEV